MARCGEDSVTNQNNETWVSNRWRPMMGWLYFTTCLFDFILFPILWSILQSLGGTGDVTIIWQPITLQGGGLFHVAMGAILGIAVYGRTKEKINNSRPYPE
jgi:hypothetical protein